MRTKSTFQAQPIMMTMTMIDRVVFSLTPLSPSSYYFSVLLVFLFCSHIGTIIYKHVYLRLERLRN